jgi:hypothetical protein
MFGEACVFTDISFNCISRERGFLFVHIGGVLCVARGVGFYATARNCAGLLHLHTSLQLAIFTQITILG